MNVILLVFLGAVLGALDVIPMVMQKLDRYSCISAFCFHLIMPFLVAANSWEIPLWGKGGLLYLLGAIPMMIIVLKEDKKSPAIMGVSSTVLGMISGFVISII